MVTIYINIDTDGYVDGWGSTRSSDDEVELDIDKGHDFFTSDSHAWKYENGTLAFDELRKQQLIDDNEQQQETNSNATKEDVAELKRTIEELKQIILNAE